MENLKALEMVRISHGLLGTVVKVALMELGMLASGRMR